MNSNFISERARRLARGHMVGMVLFHLAALGAFYFGVKLEFIIVGMFFYLIRMIGITAGYHRLFSHHSYSAKPWFRLVMAVLGTWSGQGSLRRWAIIHKFHHHHSDQELDPHSPVVRGFYYAHFGWLLDPKVYERALIHESSIKLSFWENWISDNFNFIFFMQIPIIYLLGHYFGSSGLGWVFWGFFLTVTLAMHATFSVNSLCHLFGKRHPLGRDESRNNWFVAFLMLGEGWHANHHYRPNSARHGFGYQVDVVYLFLWLSQKLGWVNKLNVRDVSVDVGEKEDHGGSDIVRSKLTLIHSSDSKLNSRIK